MKTAGARMVLPPVRAPDHQTKEWMMKGLTIAALAVVGGVAAFIAGLAMVLSEEIEPVVFDEDGD